MKRDTSATDGMHTLPPWYEWVQGNLFLSFLILAEAYLLGSLMIAGWVPNIEDPRSWGVYKAIGVVLFFAAGAMAAGIALKASMKAAACFKARELGFALFNFLGVCVFCVVEIWASLSERSSNLHPTPADTAVLGLLHVTTFPVSPTVVIIALLLPFTTLYFGFSQQKPVMKTAEELAEETAREEARIEKDRRIKLAKARANATLRAEQMRGLRSTVAALRDDTSMNTDATANSTPDAHDGSDDDPDGGDDDGPGGGQRTDETAHDAHAILNMPSLTTASLGNASVTRTIRRDAQNGSHLTRQWLQTHLTLSETQARHLLQQFHDAHPHIAATRTRRNAAYTAPVGAFRKWLRLSDRMLYVSLVTALEREASVRRGVSPVSRAASPSSHLSVLSRVASGVTAGVSDVSQQYEA